VRIKEVEHGRRHFFVKEICGFDLDIAYPTQTEAVELTYRPSWLVWVLLLAGLGPVGDLPYSANTSPL
jgi:hypothetical protein